MTKSRSLIALAIAGALTCGSAFAGGMKHGSDWHSAVEVMTPSSVSESAPWLAGKPHLAGWSAPDSSLALGMTPALSSDPTFALGSTSGLGGSGMTGISTDGSDPYYVVEVTEYWLIGETPSESSNGVGGTSSMGSGFGGFDSSSSFDGSMSEASEFNEIVVYTPAAEALYQSIGDETPLLSEHYLVPSPMSAYDASSYLVLAIAPTAEDMALLDSLKEDFFVVTPTYGDA